jgi:thiol-disulfide isomerase/thioredoxin
MKPILASTLLLSLALALQPPGAEAASAEVGKPAPAFSLKDLEGNAVSLADYKGKTVVLHFQSANCPWDKAYQPILNRLAAAYRSKGVVFIAINSNADETAARIKAYTQKSPVDYAIVKDDGAAVADDYSARVTPHVFVIDAGQVLTYAGGIEKEPASPREAGESREQYLEPVLAALAAGKKPPLTSTKPTGSKIQRK